MQYIHLNATGELPDISALRPSKAVVLAEEAVSTARQAEISRWLVQSGCLYMMAWGEACSLWQDTVHQANLANFADDIVPDDQLVITTCHEDESLRDVFWFAKYTAMHPCYPGLHKLILHLSPAQREQEILDEYHAV
jgi:hypothetical protein